MVLRQLDPMVEGDGDHDTKATEKSAVLSRDLRVNFRPLSRGEGNHLVLENGQRIFDASGGAAVGCLGWGNKRVAEAVIRQIMAIPYCATVYYTTAVQEQLCRYLVDSTNGHMSRAYLVNSGSEAMEAAVKLARQYFLELGQPQHQRTHFISRRQSYHGITLGALAVGGHEYRRANFEPLLMKNVSRVSPCNAFRGKKAGETDDKYVARLAKELDDEFQAVGPDTVCAFIAEPVVGAALGCVTSVSGYFKAVQAVCRKYGALLILDEVMCGMGRTGTLHAWEQEGIVPDIQTIGKALGGGYQPVAGMLISKHVMGVIEKGSSVFVHGHTYQGHPAGCAAALEVQRIIKEENLVANVQKMGALLSKRLQERLGDHPNVGDIRGRGLFWGIEFVANKEELLPFPTKAMVAMAICERGLGKDYGINVYPGGGSADGIQGDHIIISPAFNVRPEEIEWIVDTVGRLVDDHFAAMVGN